MAWSREIVQCDQKMTARLHGAIDIIVLSEGLTVAILFFIEQDDSKESFETDA
jgi:hypothetical protein